MEKIIATVDPVLRFFLSLSWLLTVTVTLHVADWKHAVPATLDVTVLTTVCSSSDDTVEEYLAVALTENSLVLPGAEIIPQ